MSRNESLLYNNTYYTYNKYILVNDYNLYHDWNTGKFRNTHQNAHSTIGYVQYLLNKWMKL